MLSGFYTAASGMLLQQRTLNVLSNNMANVQTPGFRVERVVSTTFKEALVQRTEGMNKQIIGSATPVKIIEDVPSNFDPSSLENTGRPFDIAINGEGYFNIQVGEQQMLTRNGNFDMDEEGYLVLRGAGRVLGEDGPIQVETSAFYVAPDGTIYDDENREIDKLLVTYPQEDAQLNKFINGLYTIDNPELNAPVEDATIMQGTIEQSNIDLNREYTLVMEAQRAFQACSTALRLVDEMNQKTASQIASI
ncbi:MAG: flagellar hook-basal body protein [Angelakisella sp.]|nr:flagellar hook-basal body protein [Angelakisella sp.]